jgi:hypothetical protein
MKTVIAISLAAATLAAASSCTFIKVNPAAFNGGHVEYVMGSSNLETKTYTVPQFTGIDSSISADIFYTMTGGEPTVTVEAPENFLDNLNFKVVDGILKVRFDDEKQYSYRSIHIKVSSATLESLDIRGAGDFDARNGIDCKSLDINVQGAGDVDIDDLRCEGDVNIAVRGAGDIGVRGLSCQKVKVEVMGAGDVDLAGEAASADLSIKGAGDIDISRLKVEDVSTSVSGVGSVRRN